MLEDTVVESPEVVNAATLAVRQVTLEEVDDAEAAVQQEAVVASEPEAESDDVASAPEEEAGEQAGEDDDFGDFDDFEEFEQASEASAELESHLDNSRMASVVSLAADLPVPLASYRDIPEAGDRLKAFFNVNQSFVYGSKDHLTPTSQILWEQLMANPQAMLIEWTKSAVHRRLAVALGAPLDLDQSLPKAETRQMALPDKSDLAGLPDSSLVPHWRLLTLVSEQAVKGMTDDELNEHIKTLSATLEAAELLQQEYESVEMGLNGEKEVLEGMVESLLVYAQKSQRTKLQKRR